MNVYVNLRDELTVIETEEIAYVEANSNYSDIYFIKGGKRTLAIVLSKIEALIKTIYQNSDNCPFVRVGRSLLINQMYLVHIDIIRQKLQLDDYNGHSYNLTVSKGLLKKYKKTFPLLGLD